MEAAREPAAVPPLLDADESPAVEWVAATGTLPLVLVCDHASRRLPRALGNLGVIESELRRHIAWDIGAADVARCLARRFGAGLVLTGYSRLVVDCNRYLDDPGAFPEISDDVTIRANQNLSDAARRQRIDTLFHPYHEAISALLSGFSRQGIVPALVSIHSFTPVFKGFERPWHVGVLWDRDPRIAVPLMRRLGDRGDMAVGDNLPYSAREPRGYTIREHAAIRGWPHVAVEIRQDLIDTGEGAAHWAQLVATALAPVLDDPTLFRVERYG